MKKSFLLSFLLLLSACASSKADKGPVSITFVRAGGFSGLEDRYQIERNGRAIKTMRFPKEEERRVIDTTLPASSVDPIFSFLDRNLDSLLDIHYDKTGNMTTTLVIAGGKSTSGPSAVTSHIIRWPNLEPPILPTNKLDSLYRLVAPVQEWLSSSQ